MAETRIERWLAWVHETFPEKQVYIRREGRVQFFTFSPIFQGTLTVIGLLFLGWVAFATVNVIFKDRIIATKDHRERQMRVAYENRIADLQLSYDEVHGALVSAEDRFKTAADELEAKQNTILGFLGRKRQVDATLSGGTVLNEKNEANPSGTADSITAEPADLRDGDARQPAAPVQAPANKNAPAKPRKAGMLNFNGTIGRITGALFGKRKAAPLSPETVARHPVLKELERQTFRLQRVAATETPLMADAQGQAAKGVKSLQMLVRRAGINPDGFEQRFSHGEGGVGGPEIPLDSVRLDGIPDEGFQQAYLKAYATLDQLDTLLNGVRHLPLTVPVAGAEFYRNDGFGPRRDPFTGRYAFHSGIDFDGPKGSPVHATASGRVVFAGNKGAYGNLVEIDHGYGIRTRYGHLMSVSVKVGVKVRQGAIVGRLGSTGRSTGPHVHYEVWYDNIVRNPRNFIEAGRYVLKQG
jgi:murein DD-endopeptidase MepM/ murein hydrolase activator NlpD